MLSGDVVEEVAKLKREVDGVVLVAGSAQLVRTLIDNDLVDELRLMVFPVVLGAGERLFAEIAAPKSLRLVDSKRANDCLILTYEAAASQDSSAGAGRSAHGEPRASCNRHVLAGSPRQPTAGRRREVLSPPVASLRPMPAGGRP